MPQVLTLAWWSARRQQRLRWEERQRQQQQREASADTTTDAAIDAAMEVGLQACNAIRPSGGNFALPHSTLPSRRLRAVPSMHSSFSMQRSSPSTQSSPSPPITGCLFQLLLEVWAATQLHQRLAEISIPAAGRPTVPAPLAVRRPAGSRGSGNVHGRL